MKPSEETIKAYGEATSPTLANNMAAIVEDFEDLIGFPEGCTIDEVDSMFAAFISGMTVPMNPKSNFNTKYKYK